MNLMFYLSYKICYENLKLIQEKVLQWPSISPEIQKYNPYLQLVSSLNSEVHSSEKLKVQYGKLIGGVAVAKSQIEEIKNAVYS